MSSNKFFYIYLYQSRNYCKDQNQDFKSNTELLLPFLFLFWLLLCLYHFSCTLYDTIFLKPLSQKISRSCQEKRSNQRRIVVARTLHVRKNSSKGVAVRKMRMHYPDAFSQSSRRDRRWWFGG